MQLAFQPLSCIFIFQQNKIVTKERDYNDADDDQDRRASGNTQHGDIHQDKIQQSQGKAEVLLTMNRQMYKVAPT